jgi:hypothetical protein
MVFYLVGREDAELIDEVYGTFLVYEISSFQVDCWSG